MQELIEKLKRLAQLLDNDALADAVTWLEAKENAEQLRAEGHKEEAPE